MATISSVHDMQMLMPRLLEKYGNDSELAYIALANPLAALEKLGYTVTDDAKADLEIMHVLERKDLKSITN